MSAVVDALVGHRFDAMGTQVALTIPTREHARSVDLKSALAKIETRLTDFGRNGWAWGDGALARCNRALATASAPLPPALQPLIARAWNVHQRSGGLYEPRMAALTALWGFAQAPCAGSAPPSAADIDDALAALRRSPVYDGGARYGPAPGIGWDLGGIGKGYAVDLALALLAEHGCTHALVDAGGNLACRGQRHARAWRVGIRDPRDALAAPIATLEVRDEAVNTHGDDQRFFVHAARRYAHLIDPRSGWPAADFRSLTVVHHDGALAEAGGVALFVAGLDGWRALARRLDLAQVLTITADGEVLATPALAVRLRLRHDVRIRLVD